MNGKLALANSGRCQSATSSPGVCGEAGVGLSHGAADGWNFEARFETRSEPDVFLGDLGGTMLELLKSLPPPKFSDLQDHSKEDIFPLPLPRGNMTPGGKRVQEWEEGIIRSLNWLSTGSFALGEGNPTRLQQDLLKEIRESLPVVSAWMDVTVSHISPHEFWNQKYVNSYGEEVHVAQSVRWENIDESLPKAELSGIVSAETMCTGGMKDFILHPEKWLKPPNDRVWMKPPRVMIPPDAWEDMVSGLLQRNICGVIPVENVFHVNGSPILGGLFGVPKGEVKACGTPILRLIMDLRGNQNFLSLGGDLITLPVLSQLFQLQLQPHEELVISSEDIRAMFYVIGLPPEWAKYLAFARTIPKKFNPPGITGDCVLYSKVLPMGYINSVALAQHLHRQIVGKALSSNQEVRRDREFPKAQQYYRTYLDNFDELSKRSQAVLASGQPSLVELLQAEYINVGVPRNEKKAVKTHS